MTNLLHSCLYDAIGVLSSCAVHFVCFFHLSPRTIATALLGIHILKALMHIKITADTYSSP